MRNIRIAFALALVASHGSLPHCAAQFHRQRLRRGRCIMSGDEILAIIAAAQQLVNIVIPKVGGKNAVRG
ncbi:hypothetical protein FHW92_002464 [Novosphingobium sp. SG707]|nr:hypothetical protein [Novosphingobium sp. SG707]